MERMTKCRFGVGARLNAGAELLYLRRGLARARVLRSLFCLQPLCFAAFMDKGARQHDKRGEAGQRSSSYVREYGPITDFSFLGIRDNLKCRVRVASAIADALHHERRCAFVHVLGIRHLVIDALYKGAPFMVLDEPTSALDPVSEYQVYRSFSEISGGKTALYISHRLASCRFCDEILVFLAGSIVQHGAHEALLQEKNGEYARLWHAQAQYYDDSLQKKNSVK